MREKRKSPSRRRCVSYKKGKTKSCEAHSHPPFLRRGGLAYMEPASIIHTPSQAPKGTHWIPSSEWEPKTMWRVCNRPPARSRSNSRASIHHPQGTTRPLNHRQQPKCSSIHPSDPKLCACVRAKYPPTQTGTLPDRFTKPRKKETKQKQGASSLGASPASNPLQYANSEERI